MEASAFTDSAAERHRSGAPKLLRMRSDKHLLAQFRAGSDDAFSIIFDRYRPHLLVYVRRMVGLHGDAEDILQDVFVSAYNSLAADSRPVALRAWLYRVAHNRCIDQLRRPTPSQADIFEINRAPASDPHAETERREDLRRLVANLQQLPEQQRSALLMREMDGLSYKELAAALDVSIPAVKSLLVRARMSLVHELEAQNTDCARIRADLECSHGRRVRMSGLARRHLRSCGDCRTFHAALRETDRAIAALALPAGPLVALAKLLGVGGSGTALATGGAAPAAGSFAALGTIGTKTVAVTAAAAVVGGGAAIEVKKTIDNKPPQPVVRQAAAKRYAPPQAGQLNKQLIVPHPAVVSATKAASGKKPNVIMPSTLLIPPPIVGARAPYAVNETNGQPPVTVVAPDPLTQTTTGGSHNGAVQAPDEPTPPMPDLPTRSPTDNAQPSPAPPPPPSQTQTQTQTNANDAADAQNKYLTTPPSALPPAPAASQETAPAL